MRTVVSEKEITYETWKNENDGREHSGSLCILRFHGCCGNIPNHSIFYDGRVC